MYVRRVCVACGYNGMQWDDVFVTLPSFLAVSFCFSFFLFASLTRVESLFLSCSFRLPCSSRVSPRELDFSVFFYFFFFDFYFSFASFTRVESLHMKS